MCFFSFSFFFFREFHSLNFVLTKKKKKENEAKGKEGGGKANGPLVNPPKGICFKKYKLATSGDQHQGSAPREIGANLYS